MPSTIVLVGTILGGAGLAFLFATFMASEEENFMDWVYKWLFMAEVRAEKKKIEHEREDQFEGFMKKRYWANPEDEDKATAEESKEEKKDR